MRLLVTGAGGNARPRRRCARASAPGTSSRGSSTRELDITDARGGRARPRSASRPDAVVNCAAWTDVDGAETHREQAHAVNADGAGNLARAAAAAGVPLVHVSTDYVFDGDAPLDDAGAPRAYVESDPTGPRSVYGETKLAGELQVLAASARHAVVRSSWLFGAATGATSSPRCCALAGRARSRRACGS